MGLTPRALEHLKERFVEHGLKAALERKKTCRTSRKIIFDCDFAARLTRLACSAPPEGRARWTVRLLAEHLVALEVVGSVSTMTVCNTLKKNELHPHRNTYWKIPPDENAAFAADMEDVLDVYKLPYNPLRPVVYMDESCKQLVGEVTAPIPLAPGHPVLKDAAPFNIEKSRATLASFMGMPYDHHFIPGAPGMYCSKLVYKAFHDAAGLEIGEWQTLGSMNWKPFEDYILKLEDTVPLDRLIISPAALVRSPLLEPVCHPATQ